ncbi:MAG: ferredoxin [Rhodobacteraceae bacterium]|nr:ferredoxin [Paracoccaceae bacterium]MBR9823084.1 ferredoxin [Paracoccaceae bacterium]
MPSDTAALGVLEAAAQSRLLTISCGLGAAHCAARSDLPPGTRSLLMLSPSEPAFWPGFTASAEWQDGAPDPMDRWSRRVIGGWAEELGAAALFPFGGPPFQPFLSWAQQSGAVHGSPVGMLVHRGMGLFTSFRGALALPWEVTPPAPAPRPCDSCAAPCTTSCPVDALGGPAGYDVAACKAHLRRSEGRDCLEGGCLARRACPAATPGARLAAHSAYHMRQFLGPR